ncbi:hypothetical protein HF086_016390 [Spodoptera exigua]|uniref:Uncharacterized protein n=1 Tax=Spodoptera exigua TaxID=7107 RepID=A0A922M5N1_SPOEX|nr:hypothetical protein HF086_016390 [Spodoptera exigua]
MSTVKHDVSWRQTLLHRQQNVIQRRKNTRDTRWRPSKWLIPLVILNVTGSVGGESLTSRVLASLLGYPSSCNLGSEVRPCTLSLTCWLRGGTRYTVTRLEVQGGASEVAAGATAQRGSNQCLPTQS